MKKSLKNLSLVTEFEIFLFLESVTCNDRNWEFLEFFISYLAKLPNNWTSAQIFYEWRGFFIRLDLISLRNNNIVHLANDNKAQTSEINHRIL